MALTNCYRFDRITEDEVNKFVTISYVNVMEAF